MRRQRAASLHDSSDAPKLSFEVAKAKVARRVELDAWEAEQASVPTY